MFNPLIAMKKHSLTLAMAILSIAFTYGQKLKPNSIVRAKQITFETHEVTMHGTPSDMISVVNRRNIYHGKIPKNRNSDMEFPFTDKSKLLDAVKQTFSQERLRQLLPEHLIAVTFYVSPQGKILDVSFLVNKNTSLSAAELENLEIAIKTNVSFKIKLIDKKDHDFFDVVYPIKYDRVLKGTI